MPANTNKARQTFTLVNLQSACSKCGLRELCLPTGLTPEDMALLDELVSSRSRIKRGENLYHTNDHFKAIFAVRSGFFKTNVLHEDGRDQVIGFHMAGDILGMDGISTERHHCNAVALEDSEVCVIPFAHMEELGRAVAPLQQHIHKMISREIVRDHGVMLLLGSMRAEERLSAFLLNLSQRFMVRGYSPAEFNLRMTREEIGSYLGLKLETVSRLFSKFQNEGLIGVQLRSVRIIDIPGLKRILGQQPGS